MNNTKIEWTDKTINPIVGCKNGCGYCYAERMNRRFKWIKDWQKPEYFGNRLEDIYKLRNPSKIFIGSMCDMFGSWVREKWVSYTLIAVDKNPRHTFQFLTKCPEGLLTWKFPDNAWVGVTIESQDKLFRIKPLLESSAKTRFISFEPLLSDFPDVSLKGIDWIIVGAMTGPGAIKPDAQWVTNLIAQARKQGVPIFLKDSLNWPENIQEFPGGF